MQQSWSTPARYQPGDRVTVDTRPVLGHCRAPLYLRGQAGDVVAIMGTFRNPERLAYHTPGLPPQVLYKVRFLQTDIWPDYAGHDQDTLDVDIYENWLKPAQSAAA